MYVGLIIVASIFLVFYGLIALIKATGATGSGPGGAFTIEPPGGYDDYKNLKIVREAAFKKIRKNFPKVKTHQESLAAVLRSIGLMAEMYGVLKPNYQARLGEFSSVKDLNKRETAVKKAMNTSYKLREDKTQLVQSLVLAVIHCETLLLDTAQPWKVFAGLTRLETSLHKGPLREGAVKYFRSFGKAFEKNNKKVQEQCRATVLRYSKRIYYEAVEKVAFEDALQEIEALPKKEAVKKHFALHVVIGYLKKDVDLNPVNGEDLLKYARMDYEIIPKVLVEMHSHLGSTSKLINRIVELDGYSCPSLPSIDVLHGLYVKAGDTAKVAEIVSFARDIRYNLGATPEDESGKATDTVDLKIVTAPGKTPPEYSDKFETVVIAAPKSGKTGKLKFINSGGSPSSTEGVVLSFLRKNGKKAFKAEVDFWQAMYGLGFYDVIFAGHDFYRDINDIPVDIFQGPRFFRNGKRLLKNVLSSCVRVTCPN